MNYYLISDSKDIKDDINHLKKHSIQSFHEDGLFVMDVKVKLFIDVGMDRIDVEITQVIKTEQTKTKDSK